MKKINAIILLSSLTSASVFAGAYVENREAYNLASDQGEVMLRVGYNFDMGAGIMLTNTYTFQREDELKHGYNEIEGWYPLFKPTDKFSYTFEPHYFMRVNDFNSSNGKDHHWEITNTFRYRINEHWLPYFELRWLDRNVEPYHREQNQIRIGTKYFF